MPELSMPGDGTFHGEDMWIDVIRKMDDVYADLVTSQTALEERNVALEHALAELDAASEIAPDPAAIADQREDGRIGAIGGGRGA
jgi:two-component system sensor histidine kinase HupT/HoxJ